MAQKDASTTVKTISFRYNTPQGKTATSKQSLASDIFNILVKRFNNDEKLAYGWCAKKAAEIKEKQSKNFSSYLREEALVEVIDKELISGYEIDPVYITIQCPYIDETDKRKASHINIPASMMYALKNRFEDPVQEIKDIYMDLRSNKVESETNFSNDLRDELMDLIIDLDLL